MIPFSFEFQPADINSKQDYLFLDKREKNYLPFWGWQFIRRSEEYHKYYEDEINLFLNSQIEKGVKLDEVQVELPVAWKLENAKRYLSDKWMIIIHDPNSLINWNCHNRVKYKEHVSFGKPFTVDTPRGNILFEIDQSRSSSENLKSFKECLDKWSRVFGMIDINPNKEFIKDPRKQWDEWSHYLWLLDLKLSGRTYKDIAKLLEGTDSDTHDANYNKVIKNFQRIDDILTQDYKKLIKYSHVSLLNPKSPRSKA